MNEVADRKVRMSPELMERWATRDAEGRRLSWSWGEPDEEGFYTPWVTAHEDDRLGDLDAAWAEAEATERARIRAAVEGLLSFSIRVDRALTPFDGPDYSGRYAMPPGEVVITALPGQDGLVDRAAVLAAIDREGEA